MTWDSTGARTTKHATITLNHISETTNVILKKKTRLECQCSPKRSLFHPHSLGKSVAIGYGTDLCVGRRLSSQYRFFKKLQDNFGAGGTTALIIVTSSPHKKLTSNSTDMYLSTLMSVKNFSNFRCLM